MEPAYPFGMEQVLCFVEQVWQKIVAFVLFAEQKFALDFVTAFCYHGKEASWLLAASDIESGDALIVELELLALFGIVASVLHTGQPFCSVDEQLVEEVLIHHLYQYLSHQSLVV